MGKSTTAQMFSEAGVPVWDADAAVRALYAPDGAAVAAIAGLCPDAVRGGAVDRAALKAWLRLDDRHLAQLEEVVHPLVAADRAAFIAASARAGSDIVVLDVPLLFEAGGEGVCDAVVVVTAPSEVQRARVLARPGMTDELFHSLLARQMPDADKRARADHVIETCDMTSTRDAVQTLLTDLRSRLHA